MKLYKKIIIFVIILIILICVIALIVNLISNNKKYSSGESEQHKKWKEEYTKELEENKKRHQSFVTKNGKTIFFNIYDTLIESDDSNGENRVIRKKDQKNNGLHGVYGFGIEVKLIEKSIDEYMKSLEETRDKLNKTINHTDIKLSKMKNKTINENKVFYRTLEYKIDGEPGNDLYITFPIDNNLTYLIECRHYEMLTDEELNCLLEIDNSSDIELNKNSGYISINNDKKIIFDIADTLQDVSYGDMRDLEKKDNKNISNSISSPIQIEVTLEKIEDYMNDLEDKDSFYDDAKLSKIMKKNINGNTFQYRISKYTDSSKKEHKNIYLAHQLDLDDTSKYLYIVEIKDYENFTEKEVNGLLNIKIQ